MRITLLILVLFACELAAQGAPPPRPPLRPLSDPQWTQICAARDWIEQTLLPNLESDFGPGVAGVSDEDAEMLDVVRRALATIDETKAATPRGPSRGLGGYVDGVKPNTYGFTTPESCKQESEIPFGPAQYYFTPNKLRGLELVGITADGFSQPPQGLAILLIHEAERVVQKNCERRAFSGDYLPPTISPAGGPDGILGVFWSLPWFTGKRKAACQTERLHRIDARLFRYFQSPSFGFPDFVNAYWETRAEAEEKFIRDIVLPKKG